ncbi:MAG: hypothetical protein CK530_03545 [Planctomycetaceae bacterium]|nr:MAG: hypothetical protein CK530_03545 [Planctomycetaceae bacterium]
MRVVNHHSQRQLQLLADQEPRSDIAKRLRTIVLAKRSYTPPENCYVHGLQSACGAGLGGQSERAGDGAWAAPSA